MIPMQFLRMFADNLPLHVYPELFARIIVGCFCGAIIGYERSKRMKAAGIRTHSLIATTAALLMILSKYAFADLTPEIGGLYDSVKGADPARIAAQVISGVSFLGAGVIFVKGGNILGLTTAAGIWATAAVGMAVGAGLYVLGIFATIVVLGLQFILHTLSVGDDAFTTREIVLEVQNQSNASELLTRFFEDNNIQIVSSKLTRESNQTLLFHLSVRMGADFSFESALALLQKYPEIKSISA